MDGLLRESIFWLQSHLSAETLTVWTFLSCALAILALLRYFGLFGLYVYNVLAIIFANIQVLSFAKYAYFSEPVALGTVLFTTTFLVNDIITEHYGAEKAKKSVILGFWSQLLATGWMLIALAHPLPDPNTVAIQQANSNYAAMLRLFTPSSRILLASLIAYLCSQWLDIIIFNRIRALTKGKGLWLRQNLSMLISGFFDNLLFSLLAWVLLSDTPMPMHDLLFTYVLSAQMVRVILNIAFTPLMYLSYRYVPAKAAF